MGILNDIIKLYKVSNNSKKEDIVNKFIKHIWNSKCSYLKVNKDIKFDIDDRIVDEELFDLFCKYNNLKYKKIKSKYDSSTMNSFDYIRVHINNLYAYLFDTEVYIDKKYVYNLMQPRNIYFEYIKGVITKEEAITKLKEFDQNNIDKTKKHEMSMDNYKKIINYYLEKIINNLDTSDEYIEKNGWNHIVTKEDFDYDNLLISYINKSLTGYLRNYVSDNYKQCVGCGAPIKITSNKIKYCESCAKEILKEQWKVASKKYRDSNRHKIENDL